MTKFRK